MPELKESVQNYVKKKEELITLYNEYNRRIKNYDDVLGRFKTNRTLSTPRSNEEKIYLRPFLVDTKNINAIPNPEYILARYENKFNNSAFTSLRGHSYYPNYYGKYNEKDLTNFFENIASTTFGPAITQFDTLPNSYDALNSDVNKVLRDEINPNASLKIKNETFEKYETIVNRFNQIKKSLISIRTDYVKSAVSLYLSSKKGSKTISFALLCVGLVSLFLLPVMLTMGSASLPVALLLGLGGILLAVFGFIGLLSNLVTKKDYNKPQAIQKRQNEQNKLVNNLSSLISAYEKTCKENSDFLFNSILGDELMSHIIEKNNFINGYIDALTADYQENVVEIEKRYNGLIDINPVIVKFLNQIEPQEFDNLLSLSITIKEENDLINIYHLCKDAEKKRIAYEEQLRHQQRLEEESRRHNMAMERQAYYQSNELQKQTELAKKTADYQKKQAEAAKEAAYQQKKQADYAKEALDIEKKYLEK